MFRFIHLKTVSIRVAPCRMEVRRITVEKSLRIVIQPDHVDCRTVLDLYSNESLCNFFKRIYTAEPARDNSRHTTTACIPTICPTTKRRRLSKSGAGLASLNKKTPCAFHFAYSLRFAVNCGVVFLPGKWRQRNGTYQFFMSITQYTEEIDHLAINIIVGFYRRRIAIQ